jgi:hypothetical protein
MAKSSRIQAQRVDGTVTLKNQTKWGAYKHPNGEVYVSPGSLVGYAVVPCKPELAATYVRNGS